MTLGNKIAELRKEKGLTQDALARELGVSNQAVSKWEANQSCPDIQLLPQIAEVFGVSIDSLFGREVESANLKNVSIKIDEWKVGELPNSVVVTKEVIRKESEALYDLPWEDDGVLRAVIYIGKKLVMAQDCSEENEIVFEYNGDALNIESSFSVNCNDVAGSVKAGGDVTCDDVNGNVEACGDVTCDDVAGNIVANGDVTCDDVGGNVTVKGDITCDCIEGYVVKA